MISTGNKHLEREARLAAVLAAVAICCAATAAWAWVDLGLDANGPYDPDGALVTDGSYVMNVGELQMNITNWGLIGSHYSNVTRYSDAPSAQWPAGSGNEYLWCAGLWVGGVLLGERLVSTGQYTPEIRARSEIPEDTIYEAIANVLTRPLGNENASGRRFPEPDPNDDGDFDLQGRPKIDEETLNGFDDDGDGLVDEDFGQIGNQMMVTTMYDNTRLAQESFPDHTPMNLEIRQEAYAWENDQTDDFVAFQFTIKNIGVTNVSNVYIGFFADSDIGPRGGTNTANDDMGGSFSGAVRASDGGFVPVEVGYMYDFAETNPLPGYFGIAFLAHDTDPSGETAPVSVSLRSFQLFSGTSSFDNGGDPTNDAERYELLSRRERDPNSQQGKQDDYRFLVSAGPFASLDPDATLQFQAALAVGPGLNGLLSVCAEAALTWYGNFFNVLQDQIAQTGAPVVTGERGRESMVCREDFSDPSFFDQIRPDFGDQTCVSNGFILEQPQLTDDEIFNYTDPVTNHIKTCAMVNLDNCFECFRQKPHHEGESGDEAVCSEADVIDYWRCNQVTDDNAGCTGVDGNETEVHWLVGMAPPPPGLRVWPTGGRVHVYWDNLSEITPDVRVNQIDFEAYRVWRADNWTRPFGSSIENGPESNLWQLIAEYDVVDSMVVQYVINPDVTVLDTLPLGRNTGLEEIRYRPVCLDDPRYAGLGDAMRAVVVDSLPFETVRARPPLYDRNGVIFRTMEPIAGWQSYPAVLDTFWAVTGRERREIVDDQGDVQVLAFAKSPVSYYEYVDSNVHNGFVYFYSVTAADHDLDVSGSRPVISGAGQSGDPSSSFTNASPAKRAQTAEERAAQGANIFAYPNPATRAALAEFQPLFPNGNDPTGVRVNFANLPQAHNTVQIYTLSGDLVETLDHDGTGGYGEASWNLISRNGQEIVSGIYLFVVHSDDSRFDDFIGKFVVVR
jgi:hypothetical protein